MLEIWSVKKGEALNRELLGSPIFPPRVILPGLDLEPEDKSLVFMHKVREVMKVAGRDPIDSEVQMDEFAVGAKSPKGWAGATE